MTTKGVENSTRSYLSSAPVARSRNASNEVLCEDVSDRVELPEWWPYPTCGLEAPLISTNWQVFLPIL